MRRSESATLTFFLDTNVFISAVKNPFKETVTLRLMYSLIMNSSVRLVGDEYLLQEMMRYIEAFRSETAVRVLELLIAKVEVVRVQRNYIRICRGYIDTPDPADVVHPAACLQSGATLITNDHHFDRIKAEGILEVMSISEALGSLSV
jgi:predicted nucleic acid-binding protein